MAEHSVLEYGAKGDGATDDTAGIQACLDACAPGDVARFPEGRCYRVDANVGVNVASDSELRMEGATIEVLPHANTIPVQRVFSTVPGSRNIRAFGGRLVGDFETPLAAGKHRIAWRVDSAEDLRIVGAAFEDWSDAVWVGGNAPARRVQLEALEAVRFRRNGISVVNADSVEILRCSFRSSIGLAEGAAADPGAGIDLEPNANEIVTNVRIYDCAAEDVEVGFYCQVGKGRPGAGYRLYGCEARGARRYGIVVNSAAGASVDACRVVVPVPIPGKNLPVGISCGGSNEQTRIHDLAITGNLIEGEAPGARALVIAGARDFVVFGNRITNSGQLEVAKLGSCGFLQRDRELEVDPLAGIEVVGLGATGNYAFLQNELT